MYKNKKLYSRYKKGNNAGRKPIKDNIMNKFIDFNKNERIYYNNLYLEEYKVVIKIPLTLSYKKDIKIEDFNLANSIYLFSYL